MLDLSGLWAGPLAGSLLQAVGARVIKIESVQRPDGARSGNRPFFDLLNAGKASVALDFRDREDLRRLRALIDVADIVIEGSRPRAIEQLGINARDTARRAATWISITAYGREGDAATYAGFGDDTAVSGGLVSAMAKAWGAPIFAGDAIADPLTGLTAAFAAWAGWLQGGGLLISLSLAEMVAYARGYGTLARHEVRHWQRLAEDDRGPVYPQRTPSQAARALGRDTATVFPGLADRQQESASF